MRMTEEPTDHRARDGRRRLRVETVTIKPRQLLARIKTVLRRANSLPLATADTARGAEIACGSITGPSTSPP
jgi:hypothetical protein